MSISELLKSIKEKVLRHKEGATAAWDAFKGNTGMIPKEEQTIGNLKYAIRMNQEEMEPNEINFVDFNGMVLSMTIEEVMQLTEMPEPNEYYNLTFEHWTKTLEEIQDGRCHTVGATYHTTDGCNYYVVEVEAGYTMTIFPEAVGGKIYWGDGTENDSLWQNDHTYENKGRYIIKVEKTVSKLGLRNRIHTIKEIYLSENVNRADVYFSLEGLSKLQKISISDNGTPYYSNMQNFIKECYNIKSLVLGSNYDGDSMQYFGYSGGCDSLRYLVADGHTGQMYLSNMNELRCMSIKNITSLYGQADACYTWLKYLALDNVTEIKSVFNKSLSANPNIGFTLVDLPESITSITNNSLNKCSKSFLIRSLTPPTLGGTSVFWGGGNGYFKPVIHIRKDATYTDAAGTTYTGLEAYAHATNWATLYANTYYTFIDDL